MQNVFIIEVKLGYVSPLLHLTYKYLSSIPILFSIVTLFVELHHNLHHTSI